MPKLIGFFAIAFVAGAAVALTPSNLLAAPGGRSNGPIAGATCGGGGGPGKLPSAGNVCTDRRGGYACSTDMTPQQCVDRNRNGFVCTFRPLHYPYPANAPILVDDLGGGMCPYNYVLFCPGSAAHPEKCNGITAPPKGPVL
ncbi:MAG TPA: hypothetical protein VFB78_08695 [Acidimicrobiales bacterium]|nr:hypothetical protein [Acidimicrobiales bacterium]